MSNNSSDQTNNSASNWADNLLVKERSGQMHPYKKQEAATTSALTKHSNLALKIMSPAPVPKEDNFLDLPKTGLGTDKAKFGFHPEDDQELEEIVKELPQDLSRKYSIEKIVDKLIDQEKLKFNPETKQRFSDILFDFFRNRRNAIIVRELLSEKIQSGNKILSEEQVNNIVSIIKSIKAKIETAAGLVVKMSDVKQAKEKPIVAEEPIISSANRPEVADLEAELNTPTDKDKPVKEEETQKEVESLLSGLPKDTTKDITDELEDADDNDADLKPLIKTVKAIAEDRPEPLAKPKIKEESKDEAKESLPKVWRGGGSQKKPLTDVKFNQESVKKSTPIFSSMSQAKASLTGPIEELRTLTLGNFRRLGNSPREQTDKLLNKINLLEKDSITKKAQGIEGWRQSPVYRIYLDLGERSLTEGKDVENIIKDKEKANQETLNIEEFSAISDLNKLLRF